MTHVIVLKHVDFEGPSRIATVREERGCSIDLRSLEHGDAVPERLTRGQLLVVMGGRWASAISPAIGFPSCRAPLVVITALLAHPVFMAFAGVDFVRLAALAVWWGLLMIGLASVGRRVVSDQGVRVAWRRRMIEWRDIATATLRVGFIEFRDGKRLFSVPDSRVTREAILMCALRVTRCAPPSRSGQRHGLVY